MDEQNTGESTYTHEESPERALRLKQINTFNLFCTFDVEAGPDGESESEYLQRLDTFGKINTIAKRFEDTGNVQWSLD